MQPQQLISLAFKDSTGRTGVTWFASSNATTTASFIASPASPNGGNMSVFVPPELLAKASPAENVAVVVTWEPYIDQPLPLSGSSTVANNRTKMITNPVALDIPGTCALKEFSQLI
jgi:hypothetical protein